MRGTGIGQARHDTSESRGQTALDDGVENEGRVISESVRFEVDGGKRAGCVISIQREGAIAAQAGKALQG